MDVALRHHVGAVTALLSIVSLSVVFGVVGGAVPAGVVPAAPESLVDALPHVNAAISALALIAIGAGVQAIRRGDVAAHRRRMLLAFGGFLAFLGSYLYRLAIEGTTSFSGPTVLEPVYLTVLAVHVGLAMVCIPLLYYVLLLAVSYDITAVPATNHPRIGRIAAVLWATSFALGLVVYLSLYVVFPG